MPNMTRPVTIKSIGTAKKTNTLMQVLMTSADAFRTNLSTANMMLKQRHRNRNTKPIIILPPHHSPRNTPFASTAIRPVRMNMPSIKAQTHIPKAARPQVNAPPMMDTSN